MANRITSSFGAQSTALEVINGVSLSGKVAIVTGGASGIGVETVRALATAGAHVLIAARNEVTSKEVAQRLSQETGGGKIEWLKLDLSNLSAVKASAREFLKNHKKLDILINNAGIMACPLTYTVDGYEAQFATCHLGHFLFTKELIPALQAAGSSRVVSLSSIAHRRNGVDFADIHFRNRAYDKWEAYAQAKAANSLFAVGLTRKYAKDGIFSNAVMPGGIMTGLQKHMTEEEKRAMGWIDAQGNTVTGFKTPEQGAATSIWAAVGKELQGVGGLYLEDCAQAVTWSASLPSKGVCEHALSPESADRLWDISVEETAKV